MCMGSCSVVFASFGLILTATCKVGIVCVPICQMKQWKPRQVNSGPAASEEWRRAGLRFFFLKILFTELTDGNHK